MRRQAGEAFGHWLSQEHWDALLTITDPGMSHPEAMLKQTRWFMNSVNRRLYGRKFYKRGEGIEYVIALERQKRGSVHSHSLIRLSDHALSNEIVRYMKDLTEQCSGWSRVEIPRSQLDTVNYVCKYVTKDGDLHLSDTYDPNSPRRFEGL